MIINDYIITNFDNDIKTANFSSLTRCFDCEYYEREDAGGWCDKYIHPVGTFDFCSGACRKDDATGFINADFINRKG